MRGFERIVICVDEEGNKITPYGYAVVLQSSWVKGGLSTKGGRKYGHTLVSNNLPEGFAEAIDLPV